jgi:hypothetical protein
MPEGEEERERSRADSGEDEAKEASSSESLAPFSDLNSGAVKVIRDMASWRYVGCRKEVVVGGG